MALQRSFIRFPTIVEFGAGTLEKLGGIARQYGRRAYCVIDPFFKEHPAGERALSLLREAGVETVVTYAVATNPSAEDIDPKAAACVENRCDLVVALGGGGSIAIGKAVAAVATNGRSSWDYAALETRPYEEITIPPLPLIAVPTTAGTGAEATIYSVVTNHELRRKCSIRSFYLYPTVALIDPALTLDAPPMLTAMTGIDTFAHAYESYTNKKATKFSEMIALESMRLFAENILTCCTDGRDIEARSNMAFASMLGGLAIAHCPCTIGHVLGQCLSGYTNAPHGASLAVCTAQIIRWTLPAGREKLARIARLFDHSLSGKTEEQAAAALPDILDSLFERILGARVTMQTYGLQPAQEKEFADFIFENYQGDMSNYVRIPTREDVHALVHACM